MLKNSKNAGPDAHARFVAEARAVAAVKHPNIIAIYDYGLVQGLPYFVMEFLEGDHFGRRFELGPQHPPADMARTLVKVARGVAEIHAAGIIHRDLKPANILFDRRNEPKVADFGLAKSENSHLTRTNEVKGTPYYMSPEQIQGMSKQAGPPTDVWALGVILYECLTGRRPFEADNALSLAMAITQDTPPAPRTVAPHVPAEIEAVVLKCLAKRPEDRFPTAKVFADELDRFLVKVAAKAADNRRTFGGGGSVSSPHLSTPHRHDTPSESRRAVSLVEGDLLNDRYEIRRFLGKGGMGAVFSAHDRVRQQEVALKVLLPSLTRDAANHKRFIQEATLASGLAHPNIVRVFDLHAAGDLSFLSMELLTDGNTLRHAIEERKPAGRRFDTDEVLRIAHQLLDGLTTAHRSGVIHRDVKPENIWLSAREFRVKLMDFGIARLMKDSQLATSGLALGTAYYMSPEQMRASTDIDHRTDQYAVGVVVYELLTGDLPQGAVQKPHELRPELPIWLSESVMKALASRPENRHADTAAFAASLQAPARRRGKRVLVAGLLAAAAIGGGVAAYPSVVDAVRKATAETAERQPPIAGEPSQPPAGPTPPPVPTPVPPPVPPPNADTTLDLLAELLPKTAVACDKTKSIPTDVQKAATDAWDRADRLAAKPDTPAAEVALAKRAYDARKRVADRYASDQPLKDLADKCLVSLKAGEALARDRDRHAEAREKLLDAGKKAEALQQWWQTCQQQLRNLDEARLKLDKLSRGPESLPAALVTWADAELDRVPLATFEPEGAAKTLFENVDRVVAQAQTLIPKGREFKTQLHAEATALPVATPYDSARKQLRVIADGLDALPTDFGTGNAKKADERYAAAKVDAEKVRGEFPVFDAQIKVQEAEALDAALRKRIGDPYDKAEWPKETLEAIRTAVEAGRKLHPTDPSAAGRRFEAITTGLAELTAWEAEVKRYLGKLDDARATLRDSTLPATFLTAVERDLDAAVPAVLAKQPRDPKGAIAAADKALTTARDIVARTTKTEGELEKVRESIPFGGNFATAREAVGQVAKDLEAVRKTIGRNDLDQADKDATAAAAAVTGVRDRMADGHIADARGQLKSYKVDEAVATATRALAIRESADAYAVRSLANNFLHKYRTALADADAAVKLDPTAAVGYLARSKAYDELAEIAKAVKDGEKATALAPKSADAWAVLGEAQADDKDFAAASASAEKAVDLDPTFAPGHRLVGYVAMRKGDNKTAVRHLSTALELDPKYAPAFNERGVCLHRLGEVDAALRDFAEAVRVAPMFISAYLNRATLYTEQEKYREAIADHDRLIALKYNAGLMHNARGHLYGRLKDFDAAIADFEKTVELLPADHLGYINLGWALTQAGSPNRAVTVLTKAIEISDNTDSGYLNRAAAYDKLGRTAEADADRKKAKEIEEKRKK